MKRVAVLFERFGPYHEARVGWLARTSDELEPIGIEFFEQDSTYSWSLRSRDARFELTHATRSHQESVGKLRNRVRTLLDHARVGVVAVPGWAHPGALFAAEWCLDRDVPYVLMSDSNRWDHRRNRAVEALKSAVLSGAGAALVAGTPQRDYLTALGFPRERILLGYDVVDNDHFGARPASMSPRAPYLCVARFVEKKNHALMVRAFDHYLRRSSVRRGLRLVGDGPLEGKIRQMTETLGIADFVEFAGFRQYDEMPEIYRTSRALILPSKTEQWGLVVNEAMASGLPVVVSNVCGCARDLVANNGYVVSSLESQGLTDALIKLDSDSTCESMGSASRLRVADWGLARFASSMTSAVKLAAGQERRSRWRAQVAIRALSLKSLVAGALR